MPHASLEDGLALLVAAPSSARPPSRLTRVRILTVVGNRPQFIKAAAVSGPLRERHEEVLVHTGQHHDDSLSRVFFAELGLARPDRQLGISGGGNGSQTARMLTAFDPLLEELAPGAVLVYGDTNSTLAGALAAAQARIPVVHVEAGMRSFDRSMPEELNRVLTDHMADLLLCSSQTAAANLRAESAPGEAVVVGDVMVDVALRRQPSARAEAEIPRRHGLEPGAYLLATAHRAGNVDDPDRLAALVELLGALPAPVLLSVHPRTAARLEQFGLWGGLRAIPGLVLTEPLGYLEFSALLCQARAVVSDSGGVQKEAYWDRIPCVTMRPSTEWVDTVEAGGNVLVDDDPDAIVSSVAAATFPDNAPELYGDGKASRRIAAALYATSP